jgi:hypothetical protein
MITSGKIHARNEEISGGEELKIYHVAALLYSLLTIVDIWIL